MLSKLAVVSRCWPTYLGSFNPALIGTNNLHLAPCYCGVGIVANVYIDINNLNPLDRSLTPTRGTPTEDSGIVQAAWFRPLLTAFARGAPPSTERGDNGHGR